METSETDFLLMNIAKAAELGEIEEVILLAEKLKSITSKKESIGLSVIGDNSKPEIIIKGFTANEVVNAFSSLQKSIISHQPKI